MNSKRKFLGKVVAPILMVLYICCFFTGWIQGKDDYTKEIVKKSASDIVSAFNEDTVAVLAGDLSAVGSGLTTTDFMNHLNELVAIVDDGAISPVEVAFRTNIITDLGSLISSGMNLGLGDDFNSSLAILIVAIYVTKVCLIVTILYMIISIIFTIRGGRFWNIFALVLAIGWLGAWLFMETTVTYSLKGSYYESVNMGFEMSGAALLPVVFSLFALIFAIIGNKKDKTEPETDASEEETVADESKQEDKEESIEEKDEETGEAAEEEPVGLMYFDEVSIDGNFKKCPSCGQVNDKKEKYCVICGSEL